MRRTTSNPTPPASSIERWPGPGPPWFCACVQPQGGLAEVRSHVRGRGSRDPYGPAADPPDVAVSEGYGRCGSLQGAWAQCLHAGDAVGVFLLEGCVLGVAGAAGTLSCCMPGSASPDASGGRCGNARSGGGAGRRHACHPCAVACQCKFKVQRTWARAFAPGCSHTMAASWLLAAGMQVACSSCRWGAHWRLWLAQGGVWVLGRVAAFAVVAAVSCMTPRLLGPRAHPGLVCPQPAEPQRAAVVRAQGHWRASRGHPVSAPAVVRVSEKLGEVREES